MGKISNLTKWQNYAHYLMLTGAIFFIHYLTDIWGVERLVVEGAMFGWLALFLFYAVGIFIADTLIHIFFASLPKKYRWSD